MCGGKGRPDVVLLYVRFAVAQSNRFFLEEDCCSKTVTSSLMFAATTGQSMF